MKLSLHERFLCTILKQGKIPRHIAFIMDGNRRFAKQRGQSPIEGHKLGVESLKRCLLICLTLNVEVVTLFAFAIENFNRPESEVLGLMELTKLSFVQLSKQNGFFQKKQIRVKVLGDLSLVKEDVRNCLEEIEDKTKSYNKLLVNVCFSYNSTYEINRAVQKSIQQKKEGEDVKLKDIIHNLLISDFPDIIVRTSNEIRLSNFLTLQSMKSRVYFLKQNWPEISIWSFLRIIIPYNLHFKEATQINQAIDKQLEALG